MPTLNPDILRWARSTAGLSLEEAAHAIELNNAHGVSGPERLAALEEGKEEPSRPLLLVFLVTNTKHFSRTCFKEIPWPTH